MCGVFKTERELWWKIRYQEGIRNYSTGKTEHGIKKEKWRWKILRAKMWRERALSQILKEKSAVSVDIAIFHMGEQK